jgi:hypothetical protein
MGGSRLGGRARNQLHGPRRDDGDAKNHGETVAVWSWSAATEWWGCLVVWMVWGVDVCGSVCGVWGRVGLWWVWVGVWGGVWWADVCGLCVLRADTGL